MIPPIQDSLALMPGLLQKAILALEKGDLNLGCSLFSQRSFSSYIKELRDKPIYNEARIWCCYFDAHLYSSSYNEWSRICQNLKESLEKNLFWLLEHEALINQLKKIEELAFTIQGILYNKIDNSSSLPDYLNLRLKAARNFLSCKDLRIPLHQIAFNPDAKKSLLLDPFELTQGKKRPSDSLLACTCFFSLLLVADHIGEKSLSERAIICDGYSRSKNMLSEDEVNELSQELNSHFDSQDNQRLLRLLENHYRKSSFEHYKDTSYYSLLYRFQFEDWHQKLLRRHIEDKEDPLVKEMKEIQKKVPRYISQKQQKKLPRVVHVCAQLIDDTHAPTKIISKIIGLTDYSRFDVAVFVTESLCARSNDYPMTLYDSRSTLEAGCKTLELFNRSKVAYLVENPNTSTTLESTVEHLAAKISKLDVDILIFHGPEPLHIALAAAIEGPIKVMFEHGNLPLVEGFDEIICCLEDTPDVAKELLEKIKSRVHVLPYFSDARWSWSTGFPKKEELGVPDHAMIATTISNHFKTRFDTNFCRAVSKILLHCPDIYYLPIGPTGSKEETEQLLERFDSRIRHKVRFLGACSSPSQLTRCMDFYFNEFPFGSCLGILDAMASGLSVITMYDPKGPPQARYGGLFIGLDMAVVSNDPEDYVKMACHLYNHPLDNFRASQRSYMNFEWRSNLWAYVLRFERLIENMLCEKNEMFNQR